MRFLSSCLTPQAVCRARAPLKPLFLFVCLFCALAPLASAQERGGSIIGSVSEWHSGPLAGARISVTNVQTHAATSVATDVSGAFAVENLPAGDYRVTVAAEGLVSENKDVKVKSGHKSKLSVTLKPPALPAPK